MLGIKGGAETSGQFRAIKGVSFTTECTPSTVPLYPGVLMASYTSMGPSYTLCVLLWTLDISEKSRRMQASRTGSIASVYWLFCIHGDVLQVSMVEWKTLAINKTSWILELRWEDWSHDSLDSWSHDSLDSVKRVWESRWTSSIDRGVRGVEPLRGSQRMKNQPAFWGSPIHLNTCLRGSSVIATSM